MLSIKALTTLAALISFTSVPVIAAPTAGGIDTSKSNKVPFEVVPAGRSVGKIDKREAGGVYICTDGNWEGQCGYAVQPLAQCIGLDWPWYHTISSFGPDQGTVCDWYTDYDCSVGLAKYVGAPGVPDLDDYDCGGVSCNDAIGSFMCYS